MDPVLGDLHDASWDVPEACGDSASPRIHRVYGYSGSFQKGLDLRLQVWEKKSLGHEDLERITKEDMAGGLTCDLGVGVGELATDNDLVRLRPIEFTEGFGELAEEVADVTLGTLIQGLEVGGELDGGGSAEMKLDGDLRCSIGGKTKCLTRGGDEEAEERQKIPHQRACCWPFVQVEETRLGFLGLEEEEGKGSSGR